MDQQLSPTQEDYLLNIYRLEKEKRVARPKEIGDMQKVAKSTVTAALQSLSDKELVNYAPYEAVTLTKNGYKLAEELYLKNQILKDFLIKVMAFEPEQASLISHSMEHSLDENVLERFICFMAFTEHNKANSDIWLANFKKFIVPDNPQKVCKKCVEKYLNKVRTTIAGNDSS